MSCFGFSSADFGKSRSALLQRKRVNVKTVYGNGTVLRNCFRVRGKIWFTLSRTSVFLVTGGAFSSEEEEHRLVRTWKIEKENRQLCYLK